MRQFLLLLHPFYRRRNRGTELVSNLAKVTQVANGSRRIQIQVVWLQNSQSLCSDYTLIVDGAGMWGKEPRLPFNYTPCWKNGLHTEHTILNNNPQQGPLNP